jgi:hypothetical protein
MKDEDLLPHLQEPSTGPPVPGESLFTTWRVLGLRMSKIASRYGGLIY